MKASPGIYQILCNTSQKRYIGLAKNLNQRKQQHIYLLRRKEHPNNYLQKSWDKYGEKDFTFSIVEECSTEELYKREDYWIRVLKTIDRYYGFNIRESDPNSTGVVTNETRKKISDSHKKNGVRPNQNCIMALKQYNYSEEARQNLSKAREKLSEVDFKRVNAAKRKKVINLITGEIYDSLRIASDITGIPRYDISRKLLGKRNNNTNLAYI